jgi:hypothetical protein
MIDIYVMVTNEGFYDRFVPDDKHFFLIFMIFLYSNQSNINTNCKWEISRTSTNSLHIED